MKSEQSVVKNSLCVAVMAVLGSVVYSVQAEELVLEEVIVSAQKREQNVQDIPVSVTAISADMIEKINIVNTTNIVRISPSLTYTGNFDKTNSAFSIRGVGTNTFGINVEQAVAYIVDDVASIGQGESIEHLADIERWKAAGS